MKKFLILFTALLIMMVCAGCAGTATPEGSLSPKDPADEPLPQAPAREAVELDDKTKGYYTGFLWQLDNESALRSTWQGQPTGTGRHAEAIDITKIEREGDLVCITADVFGEVFFNPSTGRLTDQDQYFAVRNIWSDETEGVYTGFHLGEAVVTLEELPDGTVDFRSCEYTAVPDAGLDVLKANTAAVQDQLDASQKVVDVVHDYDPQLLRAAWIHTVGKRWVEKPEDLTLYDLEQIYEMEVNWDSLFPEGTDIPADYQVDSELFRFMPNMKRLDIWPILSDYSVFETMYDLQELRLNLENYNDADGTYTPDITTLKIGHTDFLNLHSFRSDIVVDLTDCDVKNLRVESWVAGVTEFIGCETLEVLDIYNTRTGTGLIDVRTFPNVKKVILDFYSDYTRYRNLGNLATFGDDVYISLKLGYQAANDKTVNTLAGVRLDSLTLDPANGPYVLPEPDPALVAQIDIDPTNVMWLSNPAEKQPE